MDHVADAAAVWTAIATWLAAIAASVAGYFAFQAYQTTQKQLIVDRKTLETTQQQMRANQRPFIIPQDIPVFGTGTLRQDLFDMSLPQRINVKNIGYGPACNIVVTLCGKRPPYIVANDYGLLGTKVAFPLAVQDDVELEFHNLQREPERSFESPDGYDELGDVTISIARMVITYTDVSLTQYQSSYELVNNKEWEYQGE